MADDDPDDMSFLRTQLHGAWLVLRFRSRPFPILAISLAGMNSPWSMVKVPCRRSSIAVSYRIDALHANNDNGHGSGIVGGRSVRFVLFQIDIYFFGSICDDSVRFVVFGSICSFLDRFVVVRIDLWYFSDRFVVFRIDLYFFGSICSGSVRFVRFWIDL